MYGGERDRRTGLVTVVGVSIAVGVLLVMALLPAARSTVRIEPQSELATSDANCAAGENPVLPGYDPVTHEIYVPNQGLSGTPSISVFSGTCKLVGTIPLASGAEPWQAAFDPANNTMFVTDYGLDEVYEISGTQIVATLTDFDGPLGIAYDPVYGGMDVVNSGNEQVFEIGTVSVSTLFSTGFDPDAIVYDYSCICDVVTNTGGNSITVYNFPSGEEMTFSVPATKSPEGIAYDFANDEDYVANTGSNSVSAFSINYPYVTAGLISGFVRPAGVAWNQATLTIDVSNVGNGKVYEINWLGSIVGKIATASDSAASGLVYDEYIDKMYVTGYDNDEIYVLS